MIAPHEITTLATGDFAELFQELIYGSGAWIGVLIVVGLALLIVMAVKYSSLPMVFILIFYGIFVLQNATDPSNILFVVPIAWFSAPLLIFIDFKRKR